MFYYIIVYANKHVSSFAERCAVRSESPLIRCSGLSFSMRVSESE